MRVKIGVGILGAFLAVRYMTPQVFVANSPEVNLAFVENIQSIPRRTVAFLKHPTDFSKQNEEVQRNQIAVNQTPGQKEYRQVMKGVYAAEDPSTKEVVVRIEAGTELEVKYITLPGGQQIKVFVPVEQ